MREILADGLVSRGAGTGEGNSKSGIWRSHQIPDLRSTARFWQADEGTGRSPFTWLLLTSFLGLVVDLDHLTTAEITAVGAGSVRQDRLAAIAADGQVGGADGIMGPTTIPATFADFAFWQRCHFKCSLENQ